MAECFTEPSRAPDQRSGHHSEEGAATFTGDWVASGHAFSLKKAEPPSFTICGKDGPLVTINPDGTLVYGPDYTPDAAAQIFWDAIGLERKQRGNR